MTTITTEERITRKLALLRRLLEIAQAGHPKGCRDCVTGPCKKQWNVWNLETEVLWWEMSPINAMMAEDTLEQEKKALLAEILESVITSKFVDIADRAVSVLDEYGDESWGKLDEVAGRCVVKLRAEYALDCLSDTELVEALKAAYVRRRPTANRPDLPEMTGVEFEVYLAGLLKAKGYDVAGTPASHDQGADLVATKDGRKLVVQAKRWAGPVGNKAVQETVAARLFYKADECWLVTNSTFTKSARELAGQCGVRLVDGHELKTWE